MTKAAASRRRLDPAIIALGAAIVVVIAAIGSLMIYSIDRTSWAFALYEHGRSDADSKGSLAAWVLEGAAVAFIAAEIVIDRTKHRAQYFYVLGGLALILAVQGLSNGIAGWTNGWNESRRVIGADEGWGLWAASALWATVNASLPILIFILSKLLAWLIRQLVARLESENLIDVQAMRDKLKTQADHALRWATRWQAIARRQQATIKELRDGLAAALADADGARRSFSQLHRNFSRMRRAAYTLRESLVEARQIAQDAHRRAQAAQEAREAAESAQHSAQLAAARLKATIEVMEKAPPAITLADIAAHMAARKITIGDLARATLAHNEGRKEKTAADLGGSMNALNKWLELPGASLAEEIEVTA